MTYAGSARLEEVAVTPLNRDRLRTLLAPGAIAGFEHTLTRGQSAQLIQPSEPPRLPRLAG